MYVPGANPVARGTQQRHTRTTHAHALGRDGDQQGRRLAGSMASSHMPDSCGCGAASMVDLAALEAVRALAGRAAAGGWECGHGRRRVPTVESRPRMMAAGPGQLEG